MKPSLNLDNGFPDCIGINCSTQNHRNPPPQYRGYFDGFGRDEIKCFAWVFGGVRGNGDLKCLQSMSWVGYCRNEFPDAKGIETNVDVHVSVFHCLSRNEFPDAKGIETSLHL